MELAGTVYFYTLAAPSMAFVGFTAIVVVLHQHGCMATLVQSVPVTETFGGKTVWDGIVTSSRFTAIVRRSKPTHGHPR
jgi:hypothetical protein